MELMLTSRRSFAATLVFYFTSKEHERGRGGNHETGENKKGRNPGGGGGLEQPRNI